MDETHTTAGAPTAPVTAETPETPVVTPETSEVVEVVPAEIEVVPIVQPESPEGHENHESVGESTVPELPVLDATGAIPVVTEPASVSDLPIIEPIDYSPNESATNFSRQEGDENGSTPMVNSGISDVPSVSASSEPEVIEIVVERVVEKKVIKEIPKEVIVEKIVEKIVEVEKVVEKIVYRDGEPKICPPPTDEEIESIKNDFLINLSKQGTAKRYELMLEKLELIMALFNTQTSITHKDVMVHLNCSGTTATRLLTELRHENKITLHGTSPHTFTYTKN